ncbi:endonuclease [Microbacterium karelineae]|uniref:endonuclease n=1 Tax=Microbacterium karelineae TaxID=2654283 RepID=UPI0012E9F486|nr:endonuclease [Microbacterium karelineae]
MIMRRFGPRRAGAILASIALAIGTLAIGSVAYAADPLSVDEAIAAQGEQATVAGYVVGQPVSTTSVITSDFPNDYAVALADAPGETDVDDMLFVQVTSEFRGDWGLASRGDLLGERIEVAGSLESYFSAPGLKDPSAFSLSDGVAEPSPEPTGDPGPPADLEAYYDAAEGLSGGALKDALHGIVDDHETLSYAEVWDALQEIDEDPADPTSVVTIYSQVSMPKAQHGGDADDWNREHSWAKSHGDFGTAQGPGTDVHHLFPELVPVNSSRGNLDFDETSGAVDRCSGCGRDADSFEPPDAAKGDIARAMMYMAVRYEGDQYVDLELNDQVENGSAPYIGRLSVLLEWHREDPPTARERERNDLVFENWQGNRNPFVDHPEFADLIW